eukprot:gene22470-28597_t
MSNLGLRGGSQPLRLAKSDRFSVWDLRSELPDRNDVSRAMELELVVDDISSLYSGPKLRESLLRDKSDANMRRVSFHHFILAGKWFERDSFEQHVAACVALLEGEPLHKMSVVDITKARLLVENPFRVWALLRSWYHLFPEDHPYVESLEDIESEEDVCGLSAEESVRITGVIWQAVQVFTGLEGECPSMQLIANMLNADDRQRQGDIKPREFQFLMERLNLGQSRQRSLEVAPSVCMHLLRERFGQLHLFSKERLSRPDHRGLLTFIATVGLGVPAEEYPESPDELAEFIFQRARAMFCLPVEDVVAIRSVQDMRDVYVVSNTVVYFGPLKPKATLETIRRLVLSFLIYAEERSPELFRALQKSEDRDKPVTSLEQLWHPRGYLERDLHGRHALLKFETKGEGERLLPKDVPGVEDMVPLPQGALADMELMDVFTPPGDREQHRSLRMQLELISASQVKKVAMLFPTQPVAQSSAQLGQGGGSDSAASGKRGSQSNGARASGRTLRSTSSSSAGGSRTSGGSGSSGSPGDPSGSDSESDRSKRNDVRDRSESESDGTGEESDEEQEGGGFADMAVEDDRPG